MRRAKISRAFRLPPETAYDLQQASESSGVSQTELVTRALTDYLPRLNMGLIRFPAEPSHDAYRVGPIDHDALRLAELHRPPLPTAIGREAYKEAACSECRHIGGGHQRGCSMLKAPTGTNLTTSAKVLDVRKSASGRVGTITVDRMPTGLQAGEPIAVRNGRLESAAHELTYEPEP